MVIQIAIKGMKEDRLKKKLLLRRELDLERMRHLCRDMLYMRRRRTFF